jgi:hypothetical protein
MLSYLIKRVLMLVPVFLAVSVVIFSILHFIPGDPIDNLLKIGSSPTARAEMEVRYGLDRPLPVQYGRWLGKVLQGDLGTAIVARRPVADLIAQALPHSLRLGGLALLFSTVAGVGLGVVAALNRDRWPDRADHGGRAGGIDHAQLLAGADPDAGLFGLAGLVPGFGRAGLGIAGAAGADHRPGRHCAGRADHPGVDDRGRGPRFRDAACTPRACRPCASSCATSCATR